MHQLQGKHTLLHFTPIIWKGQRAWNHGGCKHDPFGPYTCTKNGIMVSKPQLLCLFKRESCKGAHLFILIMYYFLTRSFGTLWINLLIELVAFQ